MSGVKKQLLTPKFHLNPGLDLHLFVNRFHHAQQSRKCNLDDSPVIAHMENKLNEVGLHHSPLALC